MSRRKQLLASASPMALARAAFSWRPRIDIRALETMQ